MGKIEKILLVDDDRELRLLAELALTGLGGFTVSACESGREAMAAIEKFQPDLVLLDSNMPGMDGPETLRAIRSLGATADVPVIFLTGETRPGEVERLKSLGANGVISKPFDPMTLSELLKRHTS